MISNFKSVFLKIKFSHLLIQLSHTVCKMEFCNLHHFLTAMSQIIRSQFRIVVWQVTFLCIRPALVSTLSKMYCVLCYCSSVCVYQVKKGVTGHDDIVSSVVSVGTGGRVCSSCLGIGLILSTSLCHFCTYSMLCVPPEDLPE